MYSMYSVVFIMIFINFWRFIAIFACFFLCTCYVFIKHPSIVPNMCKFPTKLTMASAGCLVSIIIHYGPLTSKYIPQDELWIQDEFSFQVYFLLSLYSIVMKFPQILKTHQLRSNAKRLRCSSAPSRICCPRLWSVRSTVSAVIYQQNPSKIIKRKWVCLKMLG